MSKRAKKLGFNWFSLEPFELYVGHRDAKDLLHPSIKPTGTLIALETEVINVDFDRLTDMPPDRTLFSITAVEQVESNVTILTSPIMISVRRMDRQHDKWAAAGMNQLSLQRWSVCACKGASC